MTKVNEGATLVGPFRLSLHVISYKAMSGEPLEWQVTVFDGNAQITKVRYKTKASAARHWLDLHKWAVVETAKRALGVG